MKPIFIYLITLLIIVSSDFTWFKLTSSFYTREIGFLFGSKINYLPAAIFYLVYALGIVFFVVNPQINADSSYLTVFLIGAFFGLIAYGTYDFTNHATINNWPIIVTIVDILWGMFVTGFSSVIIYILSKYI